MFLCFKLQQGLWAKTIGEKSTFLVDAMIAIMCLACSVIYSGILGDVFTPLLAQAGVPDLWNGRTSNIIAITAALLLPLSLIKDLSALAFTSILGFASILYTVIFIVIRALDGSYIVGSGKFAVEGVLTAMPSFEKSSLWNFDFSSLVLASNLGLAYIAHYNGYVHCFFWDSSRPQRIVSIAHSFPFLATFYRPNFYRSLKDANTKRFRKMVNISFFMLVVLYSVAMTAGYSTFGEACSGNILLNYHPDDILSTLGRVATGFSILFGFPLVACGARESLVGVASSLGFDGIGADKNHFLLVLGILSFVTAISCTVKDVSLVVGLTGAAMGSFIVYICPALIYTKAVALVKGADSKEYNRAKLNLGMVPFGLAIASLGCFMTIKDAMGK
jgi:amino acid permease